MSEERDRESVWCRETAARALQIAGTRLPQRDLISLLLTSPLLNYTLNSCPSVWLAVDLREMNNAGNRLLAALSLPRYSNVKRINLEFAQDIEDKHLLLLKRKCFESLQCLESLNLNGCQRISDTGIESIATSCPKLKVFSLYWNVRVTDLGIEHLVKSCKHILELNLSGCKNISDRSLQLIADIYPELKLLNLTRCTMLTDVGLKQILQKCHSLWSLNLYALSGFTNEAYKKTMLLTNLRFLDLCGAQNLSDEGLSCIAKCKDLVSLNLTWCVHVTDEGIIAIAQGCSSLEFLSLFGIVGVTDKCLAALARSCSKTITTLDVNGCSGIERRSRNELLQLFPHLRCFKVHS